jgi:hypothetical protein
VGLGEDMEFINNWAWAIIMNPYIWAFAIASVTFDAIAFLVLFWRYRGTKKETSDE